MFDTADSLRIGIPLLILAVPSVLFLRARFNFQAIPRLRPASPGRPDCMVVIPARNESANITLAVRSFPPDTVIVVDDGSTDDTAAQAKSAGAGVLKAPLLPRGAFGKANACQAGADILQSKWVLFADADTCFERGFLDAVVASGESSNTNFLSVHLLPREGEFFEQLLGPYAQALYYCSVHPRLSPTAAFQGQCVLARRDAYEFVGGHGTVARHFAEDAKLAAVAQRHRMNFGVVRAGNLGYARFHPGAVVAGVTRSAFRSVDAGPGIAAMTVAAATGAALWLPVMVWLWLAGEHAIAAGTAMLPFLWLAGWLRGWRIVLAPIAIYAMLPLLWPGMIAAATGGEVRWKGRTI